MMTLTRKVQLVDVTLEVEGPEALELIGRLSRQVSPSDRAISELTHEYWTSLTPDSPGRIRLVMEGDNESWAMSVYGAVAEMGGSEAHDIASEIFDQRFGEQVTETLMARQISLF